MADQTKKHTTQRSLDSMMEFEDAELRTTMEEFLEEEKKANTNIWNIATIAGIAMFFVTVLYLIQSLGLAIGPDFSGLMEAMPLIGGVLVTLIGFGFLVGDRKKAKQERRKQKRRQNNRQYTYDFETGSSHTDADYEEEFSLENDLDSRRSTSRGRKRRHGFDTYGLHQSKKLYKSRTNRRWAGVCGGLAKYFGISPTVIRLLFVITFFAGSGTSLLVYIALAIALDKEPPELIDEFNY